MKRTRGSARYLRSRLPRQPPRRHKRMLERSKGWVHYGWNPTPILASDHFEVGSRMRKKVWMYSGGMSRCLGCTRRHLYWLIRKKRFPYYVIGSEASPRYIFLAREVNRWLSGYRGKGRQLGIRRLRFGENPRALPTKPRGIWKRT